MRYFTDSPFERMMMNSTRAVREKPPAPPKKVLAVKAAKPKEKEAG